MSLYIKRVFLILYDWLSSICSLVSAQSCSINSLLVKWHKTPSVWWSDNTLSGYHFLTCCAAWSLIRRKQVFPVFAIYAHARTQWHCARGTVDGLIQDNSFLMRQQLLPNRLLCFGMKGCEGSGRSDKGVQRRWQANSRQTNEYRIQKKPGITNEAIVLSNLTSEQPPTNMQEVWFHFWYSNINTNKLQ